VLGVTGSIAMSLAAPSEKNVQLAPPSVVRKTPPLAPELTAAYTLAGADGSTTSASTVHQLTLATPALMALQVVPPLVLLKKPPPFVPA
jgi:hypothetical protein